jgi:hypothetical protein
MDMFLSKEALLYLKGQALEPPGQAPSGLLLGHKRGQRFYVERVYPARESFFSSEGNYWAFRRLFGEKIIGFYSFTSADAAAKPEILQPFAYGKLFLRITRRPKNRLSLKPHVIEYKDSFFLLPISLHSRSEEKK